MCEVLGNYTVSILNFIFIAQYHKLRDFTSYRERERETNRHTKEREREREVQIQNITILFIFQLCH